jgi:hypothetical protein
MNAPGLALIFASACGMSLIAAYRFEQVDVGGVNAVHGIAELLTKIQTCAPSDDVRQS